VRLAEDVEKRKLFRRVAVGPIQSCCLRLLARRKIAPPSAVTLIVVGSGMPELGTVSTDEMA
jgi:hypothetical protein